MYIENMHAWVGAGNAFQVLLYYVKYTQIDDVDAHAVLIRFVSIYFSAF